MLSNVTVAAGFPEIQEMDVSMKDCCARAAGIPTQRVGPPTRASGLGSVATLKTVTEYTARGTRRRGFRPPDGIVGR